MRFTNRPTGSPLAPTGISWQQYLRAAQKIAALKNPRLEATVRRFRQIARLKARSQQKHAARVKDATEAIERDGGLRLRRPDGKTEALFHKSPGGEAPYRATWLEDGTTPTGHMDLTSIEDVARQMAGLRSWERVPIKSPGPNAKHVSHLPAVAVEKTDAGDQFVLPGAEKISDARLAQRKSDEALKAKAPQRPADEGLFGASAAREKSMTQEIL